MNRNIDFDTRKYIALLLLVCLIFAILVIKAFDYLPQKDEVLQEQAISEQINTSSEKDVDIKDEDIDEQKNEEAEEAEEDVVVEKKTIAKENVDFVEIDKPSGADNIKSEAVSVQENSPQVLNSEEKVFKILYSANKARIAGEYKTAIDEYQKVALLTEDKNLVASSYEGLSHVYAANKRYGTALSFALKAYNMSPNSAREMLVARIYYKTGDIDKATKLVSNILKREFISER